MRFIAEGPRSSGMSTSGYVLLVGFGMCWLQVQCAWRGQPAVDVFPVWAVLVC